MKTKFLLLSVIVTMVLCSCGTQKFYVGETKGETISTNKTKSVWLFWQIMPLSKKHLFPAYPNATGYVVVTRFNFIDFVVSGLTGGIIITKTVKYEAVKAKSN